MMRAPGWPPGEAALLFLTDFADPAVALPLIVAVALWAAFGRWWRGLFAWIAGVGGTVGLIASTKLLVMLGCCEAAAPHLGSPSGHTATAIIVFGGLPVLLRRAGGGRLARLAWLACLPWLIGYTRIMVGDHSVADVAAGVAVGLAGVGLLAATAGPCPARLDRRGLLLAGAVILVFLHGHRLDLESGFRALAEWYGQPTVHSHESDI